MIALITGHQAKIFCQASEAYKVVTNFSLPPDSESTNALLWVDTS